MIIDTNRKKVYRGFYYYVLKLEQGKYYVGLTHNVSKRLKMHKDGTGAEWTKLYEPIKLLTCKETGSYTYREAGQVEDQKTLELMGKYGRENVRGGRYCAVDQEVLDQLMGKELCKKIDGIYKKNSSKNKTTNKKKNKTVSGYSKEEGFGIKDLPFHDYIIKEYRVGQHIRARNWIKAKFAVKGKSIIVKVIHDTKTIWVSEQIMKQFGKEAIVNRIRQNSCKEETGNQ